jgi:hypothetical protein
MGTVNVLTPLSIKTLIYEIRGQKVMLDRDLAKLYGVETKVLNQAVKRNIERFPDDFMFQLDEIEFADWKSQFVTSKSIQMGARKKPFAFTENGVAMLSSVLRSDVAIAVNIKIMRAFTQMRRLSLEGSAFISRLENVEYHQLALSKDQIDLKKDVNRIFKLLKEQKREISQGVFFEGQIYDAYTFVAELIRSAKTRILLIDNYIDDTVLTLLDKRNNAVSATIFTSKITKELSLDIKKHNEQYPWINIRQFNRSHDRFLIIDDKVYLIGASIKDLGRKWFGFTLMESLSVEEIISRLE